MAETAGEKTLAPTEKRLKDAAKDGDVLRSKELSIAAATLTGAAILRAGGPWLFSVLERTMRSGLVWDRAGIDAFDPGRVMLGLMALLLPAVAAVGLAMVAVSIGAQLGPSGRGRFNPGNLAPKPQRLNPASGLSRIFGPQGWIEVGKGLLKVGLLGGIAWGWASSRLDGLARLGGSGLAGQLAFGWDAILSLMFQLSGGLIIIALIDFPIQWLRRQRRLRMSLQEVRDEHKEQDGSPEAKGARRNRQRQIAMGAIAAAMRKAQFVITNPTHFAVALTYDPDLAPAPVVLAKGRGEKALAIRELAAEHKLPCLEYPALARSVYYTTRERQMIREELYAAVAGVVAFVLSLERGEKRPAPVIDVPLELRFDAFGKPAADSGGQATPGSAEKTDETTPAAP